MVANAATAAARRCRRGIHPIVLILGGVEMIHMMRKGQAKHARNP